MDDIFRGQRKFIRAERPRWQSSRGRQTRRVPCFRCERLFIIAARRESDTIGHHSTAERLKSLIISIIERREYWNVFCLHCSRHGPNKSPLTTRDSYICYSSSSVLCTKHKYAYLTDGPNVRPSFFDRFRFVITHWGRLMMEYFTQKKKE